MADERVQRAVFAAIDELNAALLVDEPVEKDLRAFIFGPEGRLGSLETVNLVILVDEKLQSELGITASVSEYVAADDEASLPATLGDFIHLVEDLVRRSGG